MDLRRRSSALAVASDRFPRTGAIAISIMGGIGMMSAGLIGTPGLGYLKDRFAGEHLERTAPEIYAEYRSATPSRFLVLKEAHGLDGAKLSRVQERSLRANDPRAAVAHLSPEERSVHEASIRGDRQTLRVDALIPAVMFAIYCGLFLFFRLSGGYRRRDVGAET